METLIKKVVDIRPGELRALLWSFAYFFFLLSTYYLLLPLRDAMGIEGGTRNLSWLFIATFVATLVTAPFQAALVARMPRSRFIPVVYLFLVANMIVFWVLMRAGVAPVGVARAFFVTAAMFAGISIYGYTTKADLSKMGTFLIMGLIGVIVAGLVNIFLASSMMQFIISVASVIIFTGLTAWDTQRLKDTYGETYGTEMQDKVALMGALSLYLNFVNMFQAIVSLIGQKNE
jgi:FtsH-binding integral membrane protein